MKSLVHALMMLVLCILAAALGLACAMTGPETETLTAEPTCTLAPIPTATVETTNTGATSEADIRLTEEDTSPLAPPQPLPRMNTHRTVPPTGAYESPSIDQQILESDIVVVATFLSATVGVQTIPGAPGVASTYRPMHVLRFRASECLKGTGPTEFTVEVLDRSYGIDHEGEVYSGYLIQAAALTAASDILASRNTQWDDRPGVIFLKGPLTAVAPPQRAGRTTGSPSSQTFGFVQSNVAVQGDFAYTVDTLSRTWLPSNDGPSSVRSTDGGTTNSEYITDGTEAPPPVISLSSLKTRIGEINTMLAIGEGTPGYARCIYDKLTRERHYRNETARPIREVAMHSEAAAGMVLRQSSKIYNDDYNLYTESGADAAYFDNIVRDDDSNASNGYYFDYVTTRPLPAGKYTANFHGQLARHTICDHNPTDTNYITYNVTVVSPAGTLHEAFFDPTVAGVDDVSPAEFTVGGTSTEITGLEWTNEEVVLTLAPHVSLSGHVLEFISLDGNASLSLLIDSATVDSTAGTYSWSMTTQPWNDGDKLMLRIRKSGP